MWSRGPSQHLLLPVCLIIGRRLCHTCSTYVSAAKYANSSYFQHILHKKIIDGATLQRDSWRHLYVSARLNSTNSEQHSTTAAIGERRGEVGEAQPMTFGEKVRENSRSALYTLVIASGVAVTGYLFYIVTSELFGTTSSQKLASAAQRRCLDDARVQDVLGRPVCMRGDSSASSGRRRQQQVAHTEYRSGTGESAESRHRLRFQLKGSRHVGTVHADMVKNAATGDYDYRYLFVEVDNYSKQVLILEDNRADMMMQKQLPPLPSLN